MENNKKLKNFLVLQSFCPLFILLYIKHFGFYNSLFIRFLKHLIEGDVSVIHKAIDNKAFGNIIILIISSGWIILTIIVGLGVRSLQKSGFDHHGEKIINVSEKRDSSVTFLVTYLIPLVTDDVSSIKKILAFLVMLVMVIFLMMRSDMYYHNPILATLNYRMYEFQFVSPYKDVNGDKTYIGLTRKKIPSTEKIIKRKHISDGVFFIYNE